MCNYLYVCMVNVDVSVHACVVGGFACLCVNGWVCNLMYVNVFACMGVCSCVSWVACCSVSNLFGEIQTHSCDSNQTTGNPNTLREIGVVLVMDPIH